MMSATRLIIWRRAHEIRDKDWERLLPLLSNPVASTFLVFVGDKPDGRKNTIKQVLKNLTHFHFAKPYDREFPQWVQYICKKYNQNIEVDAIHLLMQIVGPQPFRDKK
jgi:DNA polymerase III delta subunit